MASTGVAVAEEAETVTWVVEVEPGAEVVAAEEEEAGVEAEVGAEVAAG